MDYMPSPGATSLHIRILLCQAESTSAETAHMRRKPSRSAYCTHFAVAVEFLLPLLKDKRHLLPRVGWGALSTPRRRRLCYLEEVLAGDDESQLGTEVFCLGLAPSHPLDQLGDVISHHLQEAGKWGLSYLAWRMTKTAWTATQWSMFFGCAVTPGRRLSQALDLHSTFSQLHPYQRWILTQKLWGPFSHTCSICPAVPKVPVCSAQDIMRPQKNAPVPMHTTLAH